MDHPGPVDHEHVFRLHPEAQAVTGGGQRRGSGAAEDDLGIAGVPSRNLEGVEQRGPGDDRRAVLVVVKDGDFKGLPQRFLDEEALRSANVLQVDPTDRRLEQLAEADDLVRVLRADFDVEDVDPRKFLEEDALALHDRLRRHRPDVPKPEHRRAVGDDGYQVAARRV